MRSLLFTVILFFTFFHASCTCADVILHTFNQPYSKIGKAAKEIKNSGYKKVLVSPAYKSTGNP